MGTTFASFHTVGKKQFAKEMLKNLDRDEAMPTAHIFKREFPIPSTPQAFDTSTLFNKSRTSLSVVETTDNVLAFCNSIKFGNGASAFSSIL